MSRHQPDGSARSLIIAAVGSVFALTVVIGGGFELGRSIVAWLLP